MNIVKATNLACPIDGARLDSKARQLTCINGHSFDIARQGYVNLLPVQHKRTRHPGDSKEMVQARTQFLNAGFYEPLAKFLAKATLPYLDNKQSCFLDAGCGEGYYFDYIVNYFQKKNACGDLSCIGVDISKPAIAKAAIRNKKISWIVGTNRQLPVEEESIDIILCIFGFQSFDGFNKALKLGGKIILVEPGADHLKELREVIYSDVKKSQPQERSEFEDKGFVILDKQIVQFKTGAIDKQQINNLLIMTPHFYRANKQGREAAAKLQRLDLTVDFIVSVLEKR